MQVTREPGKERERERRAGWLERVADKREIRIRIQREKVMLVLILAAWLMCACQYFHATMEALGNGTFSNVLHFIVLLKAVMVKGPLQQHSAVLFSLFLFVRPEPCYTLCGYKVPKLH